MAKLRRNKIDYKPRKCVLLGFGTSQKVTIFMMSNAWKLFIVEICSTKRMFQMDSMDTQMQIRLVISVTGNQPLDMCSFCELLLSVGRAVNKLVWLYLRTAKAEYITLLAASQEMLWLQQLMGDLFNHRVQETIIFEDNQSTMCLEKESAISKYKARQNMSISNTISSVTW